jgi:hypothetical protein
MFFALVFVISSFCFSTAQERRRNGLRIQVSPAVSDPIELKHRETLLLLLQDNSVVIIGGMPDMLVPHKRWYLAVWRFSSLNSLKSAITNNDLDTFGTPMNVPKDVKFSWKILEPTTESLEAVSSVVDMMLRAGINRESLKMRVQRDSVKGFVRLNYSEDPRDLTDRAFQKLP